MATLKRMGKVLPQFRGAVAPPSWGIRVFADADGGVVHVDRQAGGWARVVWPADAGHGGAWWAPLERLAEEPRPAGAVTPRRIAAAALRRFDADGDGRLDAAELRALILYLWPDLAGPIIRSACDAALRDAARDFGSGGEAADEGALAWILRDMLRDGDRMRKGCEGSVVALLRAAGDAAAVSLPGRWGVAGEPGGRAPAAPPPPPRAQIAEPSRSDVIVEGVLWERYEIADEVRRGGGSEAASRAPSPASSATSFCSAAASATSFYSAAGDDPPPAVGRRADPSGGPAHEPGDSPLACGGSVGGPPRPRAPAALPHPPSARRGRGAAPPPQAPAGRRAPRGPGPQRPSEMYARDEFNGMAPGKNAWDSGTYICAWDASRMCTPSNLRSMDIR